MLKNVVLPAPLGPISETIDPDGIVKSTSFVAMRPPNSLRTLSATSRGGAAATSVIAPAAVRVRPLVRDVVHRRVVHPELHLLLVPSLGDQPARPEEHHQHDDQAVDAELILGRVEL